MRVTFHRRTDGGSINEIDGVKRAFRHAVGYAFYDIVSSTIEEKCDLFAGIIVAANSVTEQIALRLGL